MDIYNIESVKQEITTNIVSKFLAELSMYGYITINRTLSYNKFFDEGKDGIYLKLILEKPYYDLIKNEGLSEELENIYNSIMNQEIVFHEVVIEAIELKRDFKDEFWDEE